MANNFHHLEINPIEKAFLRQYKKASPYHKKQD